MIIALILAIVGLCGFIVGAGMLIPFLMLPSLIEDNQVVFVGGGLFMFLGIAIALSSIVLMNSRKH